MLTIVNATLSPESPIEWKELPMKASKGNYQTDMMLKVISPCISPNSSLNLWSRRDVSFIPTPSIDEKSWLWEKQIGTGKTDRKDIAQICPLVDIFLVISSESINYEENFDIIFETFRYTVKKIVGLSSRK